VHLFGLEAPIPDLGVPVIDDAAQALGGTPRAHGALTAHSFYPTKVLGGAGEGGMVLTDDQVLAGRVQGLGGHGQVGPHLHEEVGGTVGTNSRLDALQAAILRAHLPDLKARVARRQAIARAYTAVLGPRAVTHDAGSSVSVFVLRHPKRRELAQALARVDVASAVHYPRPLSAQPALASFGPQPAVPHAEAFCAEALSIPCHVGLADGQVETVLRVLKEWT
jgi:dTDP-4-amino-4,6-dideoxygalactose transaminase